VGVGGFEWIWMVVGCVVAMLAMRVF
jgi:hypothetical protein